MALADQQDGLQENHMHIGPWGPPFIVWRSEFLSSWIPSIPKGQDYWLPEVAIFTSTHDFVF